MQRTLLFPALISALALSFTCVAADREIASGPIAPYDASKSFALNAALAVTLTTPKDGPLRDVPRSQLPEELRYAPDLTFDSDVRKLLDLGTAAGALTTSGKALPGVNFNAVAGLAVFNLVFGPSTLEHPAKNRHLITYMPATMATDGPSAAKVLENMLFQAFTKALSDTYTTEDVHYTRRGLIGKAEFDWKVIKDGQKCGIQIGCRLEIYAAPEVTKSPYAPGFVSQSPGGYWVWKNYLPGTEGWKYVNMAFAINATEPDDIGKSLTPKQMQKLGLEYPAFSREDWRKMTAFMPQWFFVYDPPSPDKPYPAILHRGREQMFIQPLATTRQ